MARINLLPWRAERRKQRQKEFLTMLGVAAAAAVLVSFLIVMYYNGQIDGQNKRNEYLRDQIAAVDKQIDRDRGARQEEGRAARAQAGHRGAAGQPLADGASVRRAGPHDPRWRAARPRSSRTATELTLRAARSPMRGSAPTCATWRRSGWMSNPDLSIIEAKGDDNGPAERVLAQGHAEESQRSGHRGAAAALQPKRRRGAVAQSMRHRQPRAATEPARRCAGTSASAPAPPQPLAPSPAEPTTPPATEGSHEQQDRSAQSGHQQPRLVAVRDQDRGLRHRSAW